MLSYQVKYDNLCNTALPSAITQIRRIKRTWMETGSLELYFR